MNFIANYLFYHCNKNYTTCFIDGIWGYYWGNCSKRHDKRYANKRLTRKQADELLYRCFRRKVNITFAFIGYVLVRIFGGYFYKKAQRELMENEKAKEIDEEYKYIKITKIVNQHLIALSTDVHTIKTVQGKGNLLVLSLLFVAGTVFGMNKTIWTPYVSDIYQTFKTIPTMKGTN